ncbi:chemotaxis protein CheW [Methylophaga sp.]|jgi:chemosensory pili system protein ChpC|uniref:chemotaxis protein CheW n=1 Tax=Methylophaga sp. TaxID=2024840 RepID=UPI0025F2EA80|nr:chemotaxis protein CheW [Methylophaga sp.]
MQKEKDFIHCMLIPLRQHYLLLPNPTIAEVIPLPRLTDSDINSSWCIGQFFWRDLPLEVIDLETLIGSGQQNNRQINKLCVINGINSDAKIKHYAVACCGAPQLITINETAVQPTHDIVDSDWLHCQIKIGSNVAFIPKLDNIETHLQNSLSGNTISDNLL